MRSAWAPIGGPDESPELLAPPCQSLHINTVTLGGGGRGRGQRDESVTKVPVNWGGAVNVFMIYSENEQNDFCSSSSGPECQTLGAFPLHHYWRCQTLLPCPGGGGGNHLVNGPNPPPLGSGRAPSVTSSKICIETWEFQLRGGLVETLSLCES